mgnify:CR=1 FL=1
MTDMQADQMINPASGISTPQNDFLGVKIPSELMQKIKDTAAADGRSVSSFVRLHLGKLADQVISERDARNN